MIPNHEVVVNNPRPPGRYAVPQPGQSIITAEGWLRVKYDPEWSPTKPFCTYRNGTAGLSFANVFHAIRHLESSNLQWTDWH